MSIFDKVKEMLGGEEKSRNVPEQATNAEGTPAQGKDSSGDPLDGLKNTAEDAANSHIDKAAGAADSATGGQVHRSHRHRRRQGEGRRRPDRRPAGLMTGPGAAAPGGPGDRQRSSSVGCR
ncbi:hypothetical protein ACFQGX_05350 [Nonomuraea dietziae]|uniref:hypothetical protein n=1 Tax=Nonomuraea dietziae TaxID=65515 RepID=UPI003613C8FD